MKNFSALLLASSLIALSAFAQSTRIVDSDLSGVKPGPAKRLRAGNLLKPDQVIDGAATKGLSLQFVRMVKGQETAVEGIAFSGLRSTEKGEIKTAKCDGPTIAVSVALVAPRFQVTNGSANYQLNLSLKCGTAQKIVFDEKSDVGQAIAIWQVATLAERKLSKEVGVGFWKSSIKFTWPADGDYYSSNHVRITLGYQWDVVGHELGHAIYDQANLGAFGGGSHKIDECYSSQLALSEGWASFFSAWLMIPLNDPNAHFEYMVPRRSPLNIENVPADVCGKSTNEWRVTSFLWDLIDTHDDGETYAIPFATLWNYTLNADAPSLPEMKKNLVKKGLDADTLQTIWKLNFPAE